MIYLTGTLPEDISDWNANDFDSYITELFKVLETAAEITEQNIEHLKNNGSFFWDLDNLQQVSTSAEVYNGPDGSFHGAKYLKFGFQPTAYFKTHLGTYFTDGAYAYSPVVATEYLINAALKRAPEEVRKKHWGDTDLA